MKILQQTQRSIERVAAIKKCTPEEALVFIVCMYESLLDWELSGRDTYAPLAEGGLGRLTFTLPIQEDFRGQVQRAREAEERDEAKAN